MPGVGRGSQAAGTQAASVAEEIEMATSPFLERAEKAYGPEAVKGLRRTFEKAYAARDQDAFAYFLSRAEAPPDVDGKKQEPTTKVVDVMDLVAKLIVFSPVEWFDVVTGGMKGKDLQNDMGHLGVAFDASSRLRRLGVGLYHEVLSVKMGDGLHEQREQHKGRPLAFLFLRGASPSGDQRENVDVRSYGPGGDLPAKAAGQVRVVCISDTHLLHDRLRMLPPGDILVHAGDLCYEESRSLDRVKFQELLKKVYAEVAPSLVTATFLETLKGRTDLNLIKALSWLGSVQPASGEFKARLLIGGNHDFILNQIVTELGVEAARQLCASFGKIQFLDDKLNGPVVLDMGPDVARRVRVYGSGVSVVAGIADDRAIVSGNLAWMWDPKQDEEFEARVLRKIEAMGPLDILVMHMPPDAGILLGKPKRTFPSVHSLLRKTRPALYVCGHEHNEADIFRGRTFEIVESDVVGVHASQAGTWNHAHGVPVIVDLDVQ